MSKATIWVCMLILLAVGVLAANSHTSQVGIGTGLQIEVPLGDYYLQGLPDQLSVHVYNSTNHALTNATTSCTLHLYNRTGSHVIEDSMLFDSNDFYYSFPASVTDYPGIYPIVIQCSNTANTNEAGFTATQIEIAYAVPRDTTAGSPMGIVIIVPLLFGLLLIAGAFLFGESHAILKIFLFLFAYCMIFISFWFGMQVVTSYYGFTEMSNAIGTAVWVIGGIFFVILFYFLMYAFIEAVHAAAQKKQKELEY